MKLVVGLGNPGKQYINTRHNFGKDFLNKFLKENDLKLEKTKFNGKIIKKNDIIFGVSDIFMNNSGRFLSEICRYYKIKIENVLVIYDDMDQQVGHFKLKFGGGSGGHNGIKDIMYHLKDNQFLRLKIGVGRPRLSPNVSRHVLSKFSDDEKNEIEKNTNIFNSIINDFNNEDFKSLSNKHNAKK